LNSLTEKIKRKAFDLGFTHVGIAKPEILIDEADYLRKWISSGYHASMEWLRRGLERRINPFNVFPDVKSIICTGINYYKIPSYHKSDIKFKISRYALGKDYHIIIRHRLKDLLAYIKSLDSRAVGKIFVDDGAVMEKVWAVRCGIGWIGKNATLITKNIGSWVFIGEIFLNMELEYDSFAENHCGNCTTCIDLCPTKAIVAPYIIDTRKCISYLTVEYKGMLSKELVKNFQNWVFGCDICQEVCPWNRFAVPTSDKDILTYKDKIVSFLNELQYLKREEFERIFSDTPIKRAGYEGLMRTVRAVLEL